MEVKFETIRDRVQMYDLLSENADVEALTLLQEAINYEEKEMVRAYIIILCAEMMKTLEYTAEEALVVIDALQNREDVRCSRYCMGSCFLARYMFGDVTAREKAKEMLKESDIYEKGFACLLNDMKVAM